MVTSELEDNVVRATGEVAASAVILVPLSAVILVTFSGHPGHRRRSDSRRVLRDPPHDTHHPELRAWTVEKD